MNKKKYHQEKRTAKNEFYNQTNQLYAFVDEHEALPLPNTNEPLYAWLLEQIKKRNLIFTWQEQDFEASADLQAQTPINLLWFKKASLVKEYILKEKKLPLTMSGQHNLSVWLVAQFKTIGSGLTLPPDKKEVFDDLIHTIITQNIPLLYQRQTIQKVIREYKAKFERDGKTNEPGDA